MRRDYVFNEGYVNKNKQYKDINEIYKSLPDEERKFFVGDNGDINKDWIDLKDTKRFIKYVGNEPASFIELYDHGNSIGHISVATKPKFRGKGLASKNVKEMIKWFGSIENKSVDYMVWICESNNISSQRLAEKCGFVKASPDEFKFKINKFGSYIIYKYEKLFRVSYKLSNNKKIGIYEAYKRSVPQSEWIEFISDKRVNWLPKPNINYDKGNYSFFTAEGFDVFHKDTYQLICKKLNESNICIDIYTYNDIAKYRIVYKDQYQIVIQ